MSKKLILRRSYELRLNYRIPINVSQKAREGGKTIEKWSDPDGENVRLSEYTLGTLHQDKVSQESLSPSKPPQKSCYAARHPVLIPIGQWAALSIVNCCDDQVENVNCAVAIEVGQ